MSDVIRRIIPAQRLDELDIDRIADRVAERRSLSDEDLDRLAARLAPDRRVIRRGLVLAAGLTVVGAASVLIGAHVVPPARAAIEIPSSPGFEEIEVMGARAPATMTVRGFSPVVSIGRSGDEGRVERTLHLGVPVSSTQCGRLARRLRGGCDRRAATEVTYDDLQVVSEQPLGIDMQAEVEGDITIGGDGRRLLTAVSDTRQSELLLECDVPTGEKMSLFLAGREVPVGRACRGATAHTLWLRVVSFGEPRTVSFEQPRVFRARLPGRFAEVSALEASMTIRRSVEWLVHEPRPATAQIETDAPEDGFDLDVGAQDRAPSIITALKGTSLSAPGSGERIESLLERRSDVWLFLSGVMLALICSLVSEAYLRRSR